MVWSLFRILRVLYEMILNPSFTSLVLNELTDMTDSTILIEAILIVAPVVSPSS